MLTAGVWWSNRDRTGPHVSGSTSTSGRPNTGSKRSHQHTVSLECSTSSPPEPPPTAGHNNNNNNEEPLSNYQLCGAC